MTGTLLAWPATSALLVRADISPGAYLKKQLLIMVRGAALMAAVNVVDCRRLHAPGRRPPTGGPAGLAIMLSPRGTAVNGGLRSECQTRDEYFSHRSLLSVNLMAGAGQLLPIRLPRSSRRAALCQERLHRAR
jgi:hypothetical protein